MINPERGEVELKVGDVSVTLAPEMARFATLGHTLGTKSLSELLERIQGIDPYTMYACVDVFTKEGDTKAMRHSLNTFDDLRKVSEAMLLVLSPLMGEPSKNVEGEAEKKA